MLTLVQEKGAGAVADDMLPKLLGQAAQSNRAIVDRTRSLIEGNSTETIAGAIRALMSRPDSSPILPSIHCPTLIMVGEEDVITPPKLSEEMHRAIRGSELVVIRQAGHLSNLEQPDAFNAALARFLEHRV
jgi:pimeloyl-ACP methyl ester carboxylesterase